MYLNHFGLRNRPFDISPDPRFFFASPKHRIALSVLEYAFSNRSVITVLTGEVGCGKTTVLKRMLGQLDRRAIVGLIDTPHQIFGGVDDWILQAFRRVEGFSDKTELSFVELVDRLRELARDGFHSILVIDEAQNLSVSDLEAVRVLTNVQIDHHPVISVLLVGQPELRLKLADASMRQFVQRVAADYDLRPLSPEQASKYIRHRLALAGTKQQVFSSAAIGTIVEYAAGVPRVLNSLCELSLVYAFAEQAELVTAETVAEVLREKREEGMFMPDGPQLPGLSKVS